jgi:serine/threonine protein kinase
MLGKKALGKYRLVRSLGSGSNGEAFLAEPVDQPGSNVVVKRVHDHVVSHHKFRQLFEAEVRSMAEFAHPYAVRFLDASLDDPLGPCLVMEYVPGVTLEDVLRLRRRLDPERVGRLLGYFCHALQAAHDAGIIHRDLKPSNLMVTDPETPGEAVKVMDFGFAGFVDKPHIQLAELTGHGPIYAIGTPAYVSPEMVRGDRVDTRSDLYAVGIILYELLTGRLPFDHDYQDKLLAAHVKEQPPRFHKIGRADIPPAVEGVVQLALSKYPNERQQTARELAEEYGRALGENYWEATAPAGWEPPKRVSLSDTIPFVPPRVAADPFRFTHQFEAYMPERLAAAKLRGFVEDLGGTVLGSEPGLIRMQIDLPASPAKPSAKSSGLLGWLGLTRTAGKSAAEPVELELHMDKPDPHSPRLSVLVAFRPGQANKNRDPQHWRQKCDHLYTVLRQYLGT